MTNVVLLVGLESGSVDFDRWPNLTRETLERAFVEVQDGVRAAGFEPRWCLTDDGATAVETLRTALENTRPDIVSIGAGIRADPDHLRLFEELVNVVHQLAPGARIAFNTDPLDTIESVRRAAKALGRSRASG